MYKRFVILTILSSFYFFGFADLQISKHKIEWENQIQYIYPDSAAQLSFKGYTQQTAFQKLPLYTKELQSGIKQNSLATIYLTEYQLREAKPEERAWLMPYSHLIDTGFVLQSFKVDKAGEYFLDILLLPIRFNKAINNFELLTDFVLLSSQKTSLLSKNKNAKASADSSSIFSAGNIYKLKVQEQGIYKVSYEDLLREQIITGPLNADQIALYGTAAGMLSRLNSENSQTAPSELAIDLSDGGDGVFGAGDFFLFYGQAPTRWQLSGQNPPYVFEHQKHYYDNYTYYFLSTQAKGERKRIQSVEAKQASAPAKTIVNFPDYYLHSLESSNLCASGLEWFGEQFRENGASESILTSLPGLVTDSVLSMDIRLAVNQSSSFSLSSDAFSETAEIRSGYSCATAKTFRYTYKTTKNNPRFNIQYHKNSGTSGSGYLGFIRLNYRKELALNNSQLSFRSPESIGNTTRFLIGKVNYDCIVWDVSDIQNIKKLIGNKEANTYYFDTKSEELREYIAFDNFVFLNPQWEARVDSQNLRAYHSIDYVLVYHPQFKKQAESLAEFHRNHHKYTVACVSTTEVYNEFSNGAQDPSAIRAFMKFLYDKSINAPTQYTAPKYLLLFGDASYDYKSILNSTSSWVPSFLDNDINEESMLSDDEFSLLGDEEGYSNGVGRGIFDIAVGRLPVNNTKEAEIAIQKVMYYASEKFLSDNNPLNPKSNMGDWKNVVSFVSDDGEGFVEAYEVNGRFSEIIKRENPDINIEKIYNDAYEKLSTPGGASFPEARKQLLERIQNGALFIGYMGHSGWNAWSDEKILRNDDVLKFSNIYNLPMMFASSCSYSRFDDMKQTSGGELCVLHENGGSISMVAATRVATTGNIEGIQSDFIYYAASKKEGKIPRIGDAFLYSKNSNRLRSTKMFSLLGDPGLAVALPRYDVETLFINEQSVEDKIDTIKALSLVKIEGEIREQGKKVENFNGSLQISVFDKAEIEKTKGNPHNRGGFNPIIPFETQKNYLFKGECEVINGEFSFSFIVPKDIKYHYGFGKISYYAYSDSNADARGSYDKIMVGGISSDAISSDEAPKIKLFINNKNFTNGGKTGPNPLFIAEISDKLGINTTGAGIGHNITFTLDGQIKNSMNVNRLFKYNKGSYNSGNLYLPLENLSPGKHYAELKAWNISNQSSTQKIEFIVEDDHTFRIYDLRNTPNPFREKTTFSFTHNSKEKISHAIVEIYSFTGQKLVEIYKALNSTGYTVQSFEWDGRDGRGNQMQRGVYLYRVLLYTESGHLSIAKNKLILLD